MKRLLPHHLQEKINPSRTKKQEPGFIEVVHNGQVYPVILNRRSTCRRLILRVSQTTGKTSLTLPPSVSLQTALEFVTKQKDWMITRTVRVPPQTPFEEGMTIPIRGENHCIVRKDGRGQTGIIQDENQNPILVVHCAKEHLARRIKDFLKQLAHKDLKQSVDKYSKAIGKKVNRVTLRDTRSRWGSCSSASNLNFSWRLIMAPPFVLDYLAAHEVAHLQEMNHSSDFWKLTRSLCPDTNRAEIWLKKHGASLHRYQ